MEQWTHTAAIQALMHNVNTSGKKVDLYHFHPFLKKPPEQKRIPKAGELKNLFDRKGK